MCAWVQTELDAGFAKQAKIRGSMKLEEMQTEAQRLAESKTAAMRAAIRKLPVFKAAKSRTWDTASRHLLQESDSDSGSDWSSQEPMFLWVDQSTECKATIEKMGTTAANLDADVWDDLSAEYVECEAVLDVILG